MIRIYNHITETLFCFGVAFRSEFYNETVDCEGSLLKYWNYWNCVWDGVYMFYIFYKLSSGRSVII